MTKKLQKLLPHQSAVRLLVSESKGLPYEAFKTLADAREHPDGVVIFEGDCGGTIYLTLPAQMALCTEDAIKQLLIDIDATYWNDPKGRAVFFERRPAGSRVFGGMGGGKVIDGLWLHPKIDEPGLRDEIEQILNGSRERIAPNRKIK